MRPYFVGINLPRRLLVAGVLFWCGKYYYATPGFWPVGYAFMGLAVLIGLFTARWYFRRARAWFA